MENESIVRPEEFESPLEAETLIAAFVCDVFDGWDWRYCHRFSGDEEVVSFQGRLREPYRDIISSYSFKHITQECEVFSFTRRFTPGLPYGNSFIRTVTGLSGCYVFSAKAAVRNWDYQLKLRDLEDGWFARKSDFEQDNEFEKVVQFCQQLINQAIEE